MSFTIYERARAVRLARELQACGELFASVLSLFQFQFGAALLARLHVVGADRLESAAKPTQMILLERLPSSGSTFFKNRTARSGGHSFGLIAGRPPLSRSIETNAIKDFLIGTFQIALP